MSAPVRATIGIGRAGLCVIVAATPTRANPVPMPPPTVPLPELPLPPPADAAGPVLATPPSSGSGPLDPSISTAIVRPPDGGTAIAPSPTEGGGTGAGDGAREFSGEAAGLVCGETEVEEDVVAAEKRGVAGRPKRRSKETKRGGARLSTGKNCAQGKAESRETARRVWRERSLSSSFQPQPQLPPLLPLLGWAGMDKHTHHGHTHGGLHCRGSLPYRFLYLGRVPSHSSQPT